MERNTSRRTLLVAGIALVALLAIASFAYTRLTAGRQAGAAAVSSSTSSAPTETLSAYDATVYTALGEPMKLTALAAGKPFVLNFWATWCPYCIDEMPDYLQMYHDYSDRVNFAFVDVTDGKRETQPKAEAWLRDNGMTELPAYFDTSLDAVRAFGAASYPYTVVVDADGAIQFARPGRIDASLIRGLLNTLV